MSTAFRFWPAAVGSRSGPAKRRRNVPHQAPRAWRPLLERLEERYALVIGGTQIPIDPPSAFDGVIQLNGNCSGSLLSTGRHVLTAAHCLDNVQPDANPDAGPHDVRFEVVGGDEHVMVNGTQITMHPNYPGFPSAEYDLAVMRLTDASGRHVIAPVTAQRYDIYRNRDEVGKVVQFLGYGGRGTGETGNIGGDGERRSATNIVNATAGPDGNKLNFDFDSGSDEHDTFGDGKTPTSREGILAPGDSGGPTFLGLSIAGVNNSIAGPNPQSSFGTTAHVMRVSSFASWIDQTVQGSYRLVLDMSIQPGGGDNGQGDGSDDSISLVRRGDSLQIAVNGILDTANYRLADILDLTIVGTSDNDHLFVDLSGGNPFPSGGITFIPGDGTDQISVTGNASFSLSNNHLNILGFGEMLLSSVEAATLIGGNGANTFTLENAWTGTADIAGGGGDDTLILDYSNSVPPVRGATTFHGGTQSSSRGDVLQIIGTRFDDTFLVANDRIEFGGLNFTLSQMLTDVERLSIDANNGNDSIDVVSTAAGRPLDISGGAGGDSIFLSSINQNLDAIQGRVTVNGGVDTDGLFLHDQANPVSHTFTITNGLVTRPSFGGLAYSGVEFPRLNAGGGSNPIEFKSTPLGTTWIVNGGNGNDTFTFGGPFPPLVGNLYGTIQGNVTVDGQGGSNTVVVDDRGTGGPTSWSITDTNLSRNNAARVTYNSVQGLTLHAGSGGNTINVLETASGTPVTVNAGSGNDTVDVGANFFGLRTLNSILGPLTVNGQGGTSDSIILHDENTTVAQTYTVGSASVLRGAAEFLASFVNYGTVESLVLNATNLADTIDVRSTASGTPVTINAAGGSDRIVVGAPTGIKDARTVSFIRSLVRVNAGDGKDSLTVDDSGDNTNNTGSVSTTAIGLTGMVGVTHTGVDNIFIRTGAGNDFFVNNVPATSGIGVFIDLDGGEDGLIVNGTSGNDRIRIRREVGPDGPRAIVEMNGQLFVNEYLNGETIIVHAGAGNDVVVMEDTAAFRWSAEFYGEKGNDHLVGNAQNDRLDGGAGNDRLEGKAGDDVLTGGPGQDRFDGGDGADQIFAADGAVDIIFADLADVLASLDRKDLVFRRRRG